MMQHGRTKTFELVLISHYLDNLANGIHPKCTDPYSMQKRSDRTSFYTHLVYLIQYFLLSQPFLLVLRSVPSVGHCFGAMLEFHSVLDGGLGGNTHAQR